ncbi:NDP-sugar synthase [Olivibacter sp. SDN3]|uniref:nucleotidyltransferase family protein n=1 Tax=Olivibacter sp. SDN3 TaxID=2764720 RepID=UPI0016511D0B|nr:NDP-sugar synthase [Olivibacter sp. SDN3]QNL48286.1 NDP-sugar synthase [Olivibacter sp. SDN3]
MDFAIIAAGEGSRLAKSGYPFPKPLARLQGETLIERLMDIFDSYGANAVNIIINEDSEALADYLYSFCSERRIRIIKKTTASSLHSFHELLKEIPSFDELCVTTVDTIFKKEDFAAYLKFFNERQDLDALMAVTPFVEDESPLYVQINHKGEITAFTDKQNQEGSENILVSGGVYALRKRALLCVEKAIASNIERMRNYQRLLLEEQLKVEAFTFEKIIDIDHLTDLHTAEAWLNELKMS